MAHDHRIIVLSYKPTAQQSVELCWRSKPVLRHHVMLAQPRAWQTKLKGTDSGSDISLRGEAQLLAEFSAER